MPGRKPDRKRPSPRPSSRCIVCAHPDRATIDVAIARGAHTTAIEKQYGVGRMSVSRHRERCLPPRLAIANAKRADEVTAAMILDELAALQKRTYDLLDRAEREGVKTADVARVIRECRENLTAIGKLVGAFPKESAATTNIDARSVVVNMPALESMSIDELRALQRVLPGGGE